MFTVTEFHTEKDVLNRMNQATIRIYCNDEGLKELEKYFYLGVKSPSRSMYDQLKEYTRPIVKGLINGLYGVQIPIVKRILVSGPCTIVFWLDGSKTIVRCKAGTKHSVYQAFTAALAKKIYGSNSQVNKIVKRNTEIQKKAGEKDA